jgi:hypothetical protein
LETINYIKAIINILSIRFIKFSTCWLPQTSGYSYLRVAVIRIDVHPTRENLIDMTHTLPTSVHICHSYAFYRQSPYMATIHVDPTELD